MPAALYNTGHKFIGVDFSGIEARVTPWCADEQDTLDIFRRGDCVYCHAATGIFGRVITKQNKDERQVGKVAILSLGYNGGIRAFFKMCQMYDLSLETVVPIIWASATDDEKSKAEFAYSVYVADAKREGVAHFNKSEGLVADIIKQRWRKANPKIVQLWTDINEAAINAVKFTDGSNGGFDSYEAGKSKFYVTETKVGKFLVMELPSGRPCHYYKPAVEMKKKFNREVETLTFTHVDPVSKQVMRSSTYGGRLLENEVQAISRDLMVEAMLNVRKEGYKINLTVHDEILPRVKKHVKIEEIEKLMLLPVSWAPGLPIAVEGWEGPRFKK